MITKILDFYIKRAVLWDLLLIVTLLVTRHWWLMGLPFFTCPKSENLLTTMSDLINISISLAGFVLASLTIIVTFKENVNPQQINPNSGIHLLFTSRHYKQIVHVFSRAAFVLLLLFVLLSIIKIIHQQTTNQILLDVVMASIMLISLTSLRSLLVLSKIIKLQI